MLNRDLRLDLRHFPGFFDSARVWRSEHLLFFSQQQDSALIQWAIIVKKTHGKAVERIKTRRVIRSAITSLFHQSPELFKRSLAVVILVRGCQQSQKLYEQEILAFLTSLPSV